MRVLALAFGFVAATVQVGMAGPKGTISVPHIPRDTISIDGDFSDWPLAEYTEVARQPVFPGARDAATTDAAGNHLLFEPDRVGYFNGSSVFDFSSTADFGAMHFFSHDEDFMYMLSIVIDDVAIGDKDETEFGSSGFLNDGYEIFIDAAGDSDDDRVDGNAFPNFDEESPNLDDFQLTIGLNDNFLPDDAPAGAIGVREGVERGGLRELFLGENDVKNGPGGLYRDIADGLAPTIAAQAFDDLREAGAPNPEIDIEPNTIFKGYAIETKVPFGVVPEFTPDNVAGFDLFWRDQDNDEAPGGGGLVWMDWAQNTEVPSDDAGNGLFHGSNWGELSFERPVEPSADCDFDGSGTCDIADLDELLYTGLSSGDSKYDLDGSGTVDLADRDAFLSEIGTVPGDFDLDGKVIASDLNVLGGNWTASDLTSYAQGDANGDGNANAADLNVVGGNWQFGADAAAAAVPEPTSWVMTLFCLLALSLRRKSNG